MRRLLLHFSPLLHFLRATAQNCTASLCPCILADTNRDGIINHLDTTDKTTWTDTRGAIFLPNIGDSTGRCPVLDLTGEPLSNAELSSCHDASGVRLLAPNFAAPLRTLPLLSLPTNAIGRIYPNSSRVRLFWRHGGVGANMTNPDSTLSDTWALVDRELSFNASSLSAGISLALDGRELVTDASVWDGMVKVTFEITIENQTARDDVVLRQAPILLHHHLQSPEVILSTDPGVSRSPEAAWQRHFISQLRTLVGDAAPIVLFNESTDIWAQDFLEPAYASMPGADGPISIRILLRSAQSTRSAGSQVFSQLRGMGIGGFQPGFGSGFGFEEINSGGNIETIPPYTSRSGKAWRNGRIVTGGHFGRDPAESMVTFLRSQGTLGQTPLVLETGWLTIGHVDEMIQFLPFSGNTLGFTIAVADPHSALEVLRGAQATGHGAAAAVSYDGDMTPDQTSLFLDPELVKNTSISELLSDDGILQANEYAQRHIDANLATLLREIPLDEKDVLRIPVLFNDVTYPWPITPDGLPSRLERVPPGKRQVISLFPNAVNGLMLGDTYIAPKQWGPIINGKDILGQAVVNVYGRANRSVVFLDDYMSHHVRGGEVHCGTNTLREAWKWW